jgi:hypothetical protein
MFDPASLGLEIFGTSGQWAYCKCPFHNDHSPSAEFNIKTGFFYCFQCGDVYSARELAIELGGSVEKLPDSFKILSRGQSDEIEWRHLLNAPLALDNLYLRKRKVTNAQVKKYDIRQGNDKIIFISKNITGLPVGAIIRRTDGGNPRYLKLGGVAPIWPAEFLPKVKFDETILVVEGPFGVLNTRKAAISSFAFLKASPTKEAICLLNGRRLVGFFDNDLPGNIGALKLIKTFGACVISPGGEADEIDPQKVVRLMKKATCDHRYFVKALKLAGKFRILKQMGYIRKEKDGKKGNVSSGR